MAGSVQSKPDETSPAGVRKWSGPDTAQMTAVFNCNLRKFHGNPHFTDTPFGQAQIVGIGNVFAERDELEEQRDALYEALKDLLDRLDNKLTIATSSGATCSGHPYVLSRGIEACIEASKARAALSSASPTSLKD